MVKTAMQRIDAMLARVYDEQSASYDKYVEAMDARDKNAAAKVDRRYDELEKREARLIHLAAKVSANET